MFVVEIGAVLTLLFIIQAAGQHLGQPGSDYLLHRAGLLAVPDGAVCQFRDRAGRGARQGAGRVAAQDAQRDARLPAARQAISIEEVLSTDLRPGDRVVVAAGQMIPSDGEIIEGIASVDEAAITGESAPVIREAGGDRSGVTGGTRVLSDRIVVKITALPGQSLSRSHDRAGRGRRSPEDAQ